jgi:hypothetical protein
LSVRDIEQFVGLGIFFSSFFLMTLVPFFLVGLAYPYLVLRIREGKGIDADPQLGIKAGLHFFLSLGIILVLNGLTIIFVEVLTADDQGGLRTDGAIRVGFALIASGALFALIHGLCLLGTNDGRYPMARRTFTGARLAVHGIVVLITVTAMLVVLLQKESKFKQLKPFIGVLIVWVPAWVLHLVLMMRIPLVRPKRDSDD